MTAEDSTTATAGSTPSGAGETYASGTTTRSASVPYGGFAPPKPTRVPSGRVPTPSWHGMAGNAAVNSPAEKCRTPLLAKPPDATGIPWRDWLLDAASHFRRTLLAHRDGARVVAAAQLSPAMAAFSERAMFVLVAQGEPLRRARLLVLLVERFTLGLVLEEQSNSPGQLENSALDPQEAASRYPTLTTAILEYFSDGATLDDLYRDSIRLILNPQP